MTRIESRLAGEEEARRWLARAIHDEHGQRIAALGYQLAVVRRRLGKDEPEHAELTEIARQLGELGEGLRQLSHELHPASLEQRGLGRALRDACVEIEQRHGLQATLEVRGIERRIPPDVALGLYRIAQEALANSARHAEARAVRVLLHVGASVVELSLHDDGRGFDVAAARAEPGLGLASMQERAHLLGGHCHIRSTIHSGTVVEVRVPRRRFRRWLRRRRGWIASVALIVLALGSGLAATLLQAHHATLEADRAEAAVEFLEGLFTSAGPRQARGELADARELLRRGADRLDHELMDQPLLRASLLDTLGGIYTDLGLYDEARPLIDEALELRRKLHGETHAETIETRIRQASLAHYSGQGDAVSLFRQVLELYDASGGGDTEVLGDLLNDLGAALGAKGRIDEADEVLHRSLRVHEHLFGPRDLRVAKILHNLSGIAYYRGDSVATEALISRAIEIREAVLDEDDLELAGSREVLALLRRQQGRLAEAAALLEGLVAANERVLGPRHPQLARALVNLGLTRQSLGEHEAALTLLERAVAINEATLSPDHPQLVRSLALLAEHHQTYGDPAPAEPLYRRLLDLHEHGVAYSHWDRVLDGWQTRRGTPSSEGAPSPDGVPPTVEAPSDGAPTDESTAPRRADQTF